MKKRIIQLAVVFIASAVFTGCLSMSTMQTARVTNESEVAFGVSGGYVKTDIILGELDTIGIAAPLLELSGRYGITEKLDIGARLGIIGTAGVDAKFQFLGDKSSTLAASTGLGVYYLSITSSSSVGESSSESKSNIVDLHIPLYFSVHPTDYFAFYATPKYVLRMNNYTSNDTKDSSQSSWLGVSTGIRLGRKTGFFAEYSYFGTNSYNAPFGQFMLGVGIGIN